MIRISLNAIIYVFICIIDIMYDLFDAVVTKLITIKIYYRTRTYLI